MDNFQGEPAPRIPRILERLSLLHFPCAVFTCAAVLIGCASPGEPVERKPPVPLAVSDLAAEQVGNSAALTFTVPTETADRKSLDQSPGIEIFRDFAPAPATAAPAAAAKNSAPVPTRPLVTIPPAMVSHYIAQGRFRYVDALQPEDFSQHPNSVALYAVRTRLSEKKESLPSNVAALRLDPLPDPIDDLRAEVTHSGIQLAWTPPANTPVGPAPAIVSYRIYRAESPSTASTQARASQPAPELIKMAEAQLPAYLDAQVQFGNTYTYSVRSVVQLAGQEMESADSNRLTILARDMFPPAAPQGLVVVFVPAPAGQHARLELSWAISPETDLAGYNVYRSEQAGVQGTRLNNDLLPTPAFQDMNTVPGPTYFYSVTAVDRSDNESLASAAVSGTMPAESQPIP
jgi:hypothetical protein